MWFGQSVCKVEQIFWHSDCRQQLQLGYIGIFVVVILKHFLTLPPHARQVQDFRTGGALRGLDGDKHFYRILEVLTVVRRDFWVDTLQHFFIEARHVIRSKRRSKCN